MRKKLEEVRMKGERISLCFKLFHSIYERLLEAEKKRLHQNFPHAIQLVENPKFTESVLLCSAEILFHVFSNAELSFPSSLSLLPSLSPFDYLKVIQSVCLHCPEFVSSVLKSHLTNIEQQILEKFAWKKGSELFSYFFPPASPSSPSPSPIQSHLSLLFDSFIHLLFFSSSNNSNNPNNPSNDNSNNNESGNNPTSSLSNSNIVPLSPLRISAHKHSVFVFSPRNFFSSFLF